MTAEAERRGGRRTIPWRLIGWGTAAGLLLLPLVAGAPWTGFDFLFAGAILAAVGGAFELAVRMSPSIAYRAGVAVALAASFLLVWVNAAVGIIGSEDDPANLMYFGVLAVALLGAAVAAFRADGMARAMFAAAIAQALVAAIALLAGMGALEPPGRTGILALNLFFAMLWILSAALFRKAAREPIVTGPAAQP